MSSVNVQDGEDLNLVGHGEGDVAGSSGTAEPGYARTRGILAGAVAAMVAVLALLAHSGHGASKAAPAGMIMAQDGVAAPTQLQDPEGRCLAQQVIKEKTVLVLAKCNEKDEHQFWVVDSVAGRIRTKSGEMCVEQESYTTENGQARPLRLDECMPGYHLQRIVGMCLHGDTKEIGTWAFARSCDSSVEPPLTGTSMFCFMAVLPDSGEVALKDAAQARGASIFACEGNKVYWSTHSEMVQSGEAVFLGNANGFMNLWKQVFEDKLYKSYDWTVKVDPDTVWMPQRLRDRMGGWQTRIHDKAYIMNTWISFGFLGPIEIFSQLAVVRLSDRAPAFCPAHDWEGEDGWIKWCLDHNNVTAKEDRNLLNSKCTVDLCSDGSFAAFHYFKDPDSWNACLDRMQWR